MDYPVLEEMIGHFNAPSVYVWRQTPFYVIQSRDNGTSESAHVFIFWLLSTRRIEMTMVRPAAD